MDAAEYKHLVLGLIFVKYISDTFAARRAEVVARLADPADEYFYGDASPEDLAAEADDRDYYTAVNVFWVPEAARWETLRAQAKRPEIGKLIDEALGLIEAENPKLKGILDKRYARAQLPDGKLGELVDLVSTIGFGENPSAARDVLGQVYEYFLGMFASAEGKRGGQFYTPASIVKTLVAVLAPHHGQVYDPCCGSGGMFVQSERFIEAHGGKLGDVSIYGQEANPTTWRLAAMNLAIRGIDFNLGREPGDTFTRNQHPDLRADFILANPPFNISDWWHGSLEGDPRRHYGDPPQGNANYAWLQHMLHHLKPTGRAGIVLANGSMSSSQNNEGVIRAAMVEADVVEVMVALPGQLFFNTQIPACLWFLAKRKPAARKGQVLFIDARKLGRMISRVQCEFADDEIAPIAGTVAAWRGETAAGEVVGDYADVPGFCRSVSLAEIAQHGYVLTPGRYVGAEEVEDDDEAFAVKMMRLPTGSVKALHPSDDSPHCHQPLLKRAPSKLRGKSIQSGGVMLKAHTIAGLLVASLLSPAANAQVQWSWTFESASVGSYGTSDTVYAQATISNSSTSSQSLKLSDMWRGYSMYAPVKDGVVDCCTYASGFGHGEPFPWPVLTQQLLSSVIAPGQSQTFDFIWLAPSSSFGVAPGNYSVDATFTICPNTTCEAADSKVQTFTWAVSAVPEQSATALLALGLGVVSWAARRRRARP